MNGIIGFKDLKELFRNEKKLGVVIIAGFSIIILIAFSGLSSAGSEQSNDMFFDYKKQSEYENALENKLCSILSEIEGIGSIDVMITLDTSEENCYSNDDDELLCIKTPSVRGVIVVCDKGDDVVIQEKIVSAVTGAFGISTTRISVIN